MALTRRDIADDFDAVDEQIADLNEHKRQVLTDYRAQLVAEHMTKDEVKLEVEATKAAIKLLRAKAKDATAVEEKDALVDEIADEISRSRARRATRVENIDEFGSDDIGVSDTIDRAERRRQRTSDSMDDAKALSAQAAALGLINPEAHAETARIADAVATKFGNGPIPEHDADGVIIEPQSPQPAASDLTVPQALTGQVATHTLETAEPVHSIEGIKEPKTVAADANAGGLYENAVTTDPIETETADVKSIGLVIENTMKRDGASEASVSSVEIAAPLYAEPGIVTREQNGREPMVAHPYATCWPVNTIDVSHGVQKPIVKIGGLILDGRGRYLAARKVHTSPNSTLEYPTVQYDGDDDLADSIRWNLESRSNMSEAALRIVAQKLAKLAPERADEILERMGLAQVSEAAE